MSNSIAHNTTETYKHLKVKLGDIYLFDDFFVGEFDEGVDINFRNFSDISEIVKTYFENRPFGFISNRVNSYSLNLNDAELFNESFPNLKAYAVVAYNSMTEKVFEIENYFFKFNRQEFKDIDEAISWIKNLSCAN
jgi:hypothetical protein